MMASWKMVGTKADTVSRHELAALLLLHPDSVSRNLKAGLAAAILSWGGHGQEQTFSRSRALRWSRAMACRRRNLGAPCSRCRDVLFDCDAVAEHLLETRHGYAGCRECGSTWELIQPCET